jgi:hypothetical protein
LKNIQGKIINKNSKILTFFKLLLPMTQDRVYRLGDKLIIKIFSNLLKIDPEEMRTDLESGDISETIKKYFKQSNLYIDESDITIEQVDTFLDDLSTMTKLDEQNYMFKTFIFNKMSYEELKWLIRIIKGDLRIFLGPKQVLKAVSLIILKS